MSYRHRILVALLVVGVAPIALLGWSSYRVNRAEVTGTVGAAHVRTAVELARSCERVVLDGLESLRLSASYIPFDSLTAPQITAALAIPYRQVKALNALVLLDARGTALAQPVRRAETAAAGAEHEPMDDSELDAFSRHVPLDAALQTGAAVGPPYRSPTSGLPRVAVAVKLAAERVLAAELSLREISERLDDVGSSSGAAMLVDHEGRSFGGHASERAPSADEASVVRASLSAGPVARLVRRADGQNWLLAQAPVEGLSWSVLVMQPESTALGAALRVRRYTFFWAGISLLLALVLGVVLARDLARPIARVCGAARAMSQGDYSVRVPVEGADELATLHVAFNGMATEVQRRDDEIRAWNVELQSRVDRKTAELRAAHDQVERSRRLAAVGSLGAGVAHGLNNPMTSIVGLVSLARAEAGPHGEVGRLLATALDEARRVTQIVRNLRELAHEEQGSGQSFPLDRPVLAALDARRETISERAVRVETSVAPDLRPAIGSAADIERVVGHLVDNALAAMPRGGDLHVAISSVDDAALKLSIADTGVGIPPENRQRIFDPFFTTQPGSRAGLGLSVSHSIVEAHHGKLWVDSEPGKGARFTVVLPAAAQPHLA